jgi:FHS family L-fucose permease-like MFS transporter
VLLGLFVLASGITILQVAANPLAAALGDPKYSHFRLTFSQTFNSLGTFIGPYVGAVLFLKGIETKACEATSQSARLTSLAGIDRAYFWICGFIIALALLFIVFRRVVTEQAPAARRDRDLPLRRRRGVYWHADGLLPSLGFRVGEDRRAVRLPAYRAHHGQ